MLHAHSPVPHSRRMMLLSFVELQTKKNDDTLPHIVTQGVASINNCSITVIKSIIVINFTFLFYQRPGGYIKSIVRALNKLL